MGTFPSWMEDDYNKIANKGPLSTLIFGHRFKVDQTLYEYLTEFLLVFVSAKNEDLQEGKMQFHDVTIEKNLSYWVEPRMALRRFIFYDKAKKKGAIPADSIAYREMVKHLVDKMDVNDKELAKEYVEDIQDLFHGYAAVVRNRFWGAQTLLPICPEFVLCGVDPTEKKRKKEVYWENDPESLDTKFDFTKHNFLSRGGELYYLHLLQGVEGDKDRRERLEKLLNDMLNGSCKKISKLARYVQDTWEEQYALDKKVLSQRLEVAYIPATGYKECGSFSVDELNSFLSCKLHPITRVEILAKGVMFQIMRMMSCRVADYLAKERPAWIVDMKGETIDTVKKIAHESFLNIESDFMTAINKMANEAGITEEERMKKVREARINSLDIFKSKGKELQCIIPVSGPFERFSLSEDAIRFLVLSLVAPGDKMTLKMFLEKLYRNYRIVIGPEEYRQSLENIIMDSSLANSFAENVVAFQEFLRSTGFLKELSDATSIVVNPYESIEEVEA
ncbi:hypothetical protein MUB35_19855 [Blautia sp. NSJ-175]|uniref:hypothetical protein n=1 Tax=Blautia sp. NSJ-175 TaxID=2931396 RepID=UPI001FD57A2E|nr:hypothetical protein [Blautia sp. NSJ-175]MCJ7847581.1 hypothetical protein [Blautia sp. NSJ-175]